MNEASAQSLVPAPPGAQSERIPRQRAQGLAYARASGIGLGIFLLAWAPLSLWRWEPLGAPGPSAALAAAAVLLALLLLVPVNRLPRRAWNLAFGALCFLAAAFVFLNVFDAIYQYMLVHSLGERPAPPAFKSLLVFLALLQPPTALFRRRPALLD